MFKPPRWWSDKNKLKVVFKLQFHASQVTQFGGDGLMISVVPADIGKPTAKSGKATVRDGSCLWENPVYETVKFSQDPRSGKIHERLYHFVVGMGLSKSGVYGEASIDFSNYAEATKASLVSLPLRNSKSGAVLHVSIQRVQESMDQRDIKENENANLYSEEHILSSQLGNHDTDGTIRSSSVEDEPSDKIVSKAEYNTKRRGSSGSDVTLSSCESSSGNETHWELKNDHIHQGPKSDTPTTPLYDENQSSWEWLGNSAIEGSTDDTEESPDIVIEKLKAEVAALSRQTEMSDLELQALRKQIVKESKRGQDLWREVICLKEERDALKGECEQLKALRRTKTNLDFDEVDSQAIVEELRQELCHAKELNANLRIQLEKTQESNSELIFAVQDLEEMLEQKNGEISNTSDRSLEKGVDEKPREVVIKYQPDHDVDDEDDDEEEQKALEDLVKEHNDARESSILEQQIMDLQSEIEIYKRDKDELEMQMEQLALDYEIMKQANHEMSSQLRQSQIQEQLKIQYECSSPDAAAHELETCVENLENELKTRSKEYEASLITISKLQAHAKRVEEELETRVENLENELKTRSQEYEDSLVALSELQAHTKTLEEELEKQAQEFQADLEAISQSKVEQEQRAINAEQMLKQMRWRNANTAERIQDEFRKLSVQMASTFEANEKLSTKAMAEANELRLQKIHLEEMLHKNSEEHKAVKGHYETRLQQLTSQVTSMTNEIEHQKKHAEDTQRLLSDEILMLKDEIVTLVAKNEILLEDMESKEALMHELDKMKISIKEMELLVEQGNDEKIELESRVLLLKTEAEELHKELNKLKSLVKENELTTGLQLRIDLKKKEDASNGMEKKIKDGRIRATTVDAVKGTSKTSKSHPRESKEVGNLKERIKSLECQIRLKETALQNSANAFLKKEKDFLNKIEELDGRLGVNENAVQMAAAIVVEDKAPNCQEILTKKRNKLSEECGNGNAGSKELEKEIGLLKERNIAMERDLMEMQERYLDISLKFAEVEGERQQLVMKLRNLTNATKSS